MLTREVDVLQIDSTVKQILHEIDQIDDKEDIRDYKGRVRHKEHIRNYLFGSYYGIREVVKCISRLGLGKKILDIGIAYGFYDIILKEDFGLDITGMELQENIAAYSFLPKLHNIQMIAGGLSQKPCLIPDNSFDVVIFSEVIEHLRISPIRALLEINRILKPEGLLLITTPNVARLSNILRLFIGKNIVEMFPDDDSELNHVTDRMTHIREYTMDELKMLLRRAGYKIIEAKYSLSNDRIPPQENIGRKSKSICLMLLPVVTIIPAFRSLLFILGQKNK